MSRNVSGLLTLFLMVLMMVGVWLANSSGTTLIGLLLGLCAAVGLTVLARRENSLPLGQGERAAWEVTRAKGKRFYILRSGMYGLFLGLILLLFEVMRSRWTGEPFTTPFNFVLFALIIMVYIAGSFFTAIRKWSLYEERYKEKR
jgi:hypothetical protein